MFIVIDFEVEKRKFSGAICLKKDVKEEKLCLPVIIFLNGLGCGENKNIKKISNLFC